MTHTRNTRMTFATLLALAIVLFASNTFAALNAYLQLKGTKSGKIYKSSLDASGKFSFSNVEPGTYSLIFVSEDGSNPPASIEIQSFSWGATNSGSMSSGSMSSGRASASATTSKNSPVTRSNISNNRVSCPSGVTVSTGDLDGDGIPDVITSPVTISISNADGSRGQVFSKVVLQDITVSSACSPSGACKGNWNLKENVK
ncbi:MAG: FG-GAP repeat protein [Bacteroidetes bacterium]|nr:FG-GAP repeat protein [Bacteroidota bacterium]